MPPVVRDTLSLRPQGFYGYAFLAVRVAEIISLIVITGIVSRTYSSRLPQANRCMSRNTT